ncbi:hypothetical protein [Roseomonas indoligenes]|uniref:N,N-dimethylformamidase alpha subunit domain-containing protein n=1 Tax=Roseomonas indoligenes TaxID=2820811 RepID=A0A940N1D9_9PROT|nr:hypothetical protein [Pararoseomonas indoligenes]MBP0496146.1 hypothetical protein [Pararoseomonas indoligenes]
MLVNDPAAAHWPFDPSRVELALEFRRRPRGPHGDSLQKLLHRMRWNGDAERGARWILVVVEPNRRWMLAELPFRRNQPVRTFPNEIFTSLAEAEWEVFKRRWAALAGNPLPESIADAPAGT